jgi:hypothetical protein
MYLQEDWRTSKQYLTKRRGGEEEREGECEKVDFEKDNTTHPHSFHPTESLAPWEAVQWLVGCLPSTDAIENQREFGVRFTQRFSALDLNE